MKIKSMDRREFYTWLNVDLEQGENENQVNQWCIDTGCGKLVKVNTFSFKNENEITMFCMRWVNK